MSQEGEHRFPGKEERKKEERKLGMCNAWSGEYNTGMYS